MTVTNTPPNETKMPELRPQMSTETTLLRVQVEQLQTRLGHCEAALEERDADLQAAREKLAQSIAAAAGGQKELADLHDTLRRLYDRMPMLPITGDTIDAATDTLHELCLAIGVHEIDIDKPSPASPPVEGQNDDLTAAYMLGRYDRRKSATTPPEGQDGIRREEGWCDGCPTHAELRRLLNHERGVTKRLVSEDNARFAQEQASNTPPEGQSVEQRATG